MITQILQWNNSLIRKLFLSIIVSFISTHSFCQDSREELVQRYLNVGRHLVEIRNFDSAAVIFKKAFVKNAVLPDELLYFYGFTLFNKGEIDAGKKYIDKYLSIVKPNAEFYKHALKVSEDIEKAIDRQSILCNSCEGKGYHNQPCEHCRQTGEQKCKVCSGKGKVLIGGTQGMRFGVCTTCMGKGVSACEVCDGTKEIHQTCMVCKGKGKVRKVMEAIKN